MKIVLCLTLSICITALGGAVVTRLEGYLGTAPDIVTIPVLSVLFFGTIALVWAPWYFIFIRER
jgi:hypothetical protein